MATRQTRKPVGRKPTAPAKRTAAPARRPAKASAKPQRADVTSYADKPATDYHKAFARWIVEEVGYDPETASSKRMAFLKGVSIATAARPAFMESEFLEEWRDRTGTTKRGPKTQEEATPTRRRKAEPAPEPEFEDEEDDFESDEEEEDFEDDEESDADEDDEDFEDDEDDNGEEDDFEEEEEAPPAKRRRAVPAKPTARKATPARKAAPAKKAVPAAKGRRPAKAADDDFIF